MGVPTSAGSCRLPCQGRSPRCPLGVPAAGGGHAWPAALAATPPSGRAGARFVRRFLHPAPSPGRGDRVSPGSAADCGTRRPPAHRAGGHGVVTPCSRAGHPAKCRGDRRGHASGISCWSSPQHPSSPSQATPHGKHRWSSPTQGLPSPGITSHATKAKEGGDTAVPSVTARPRATGRFGCPSANSV